MKKLLFGLLLLIMMTIQAQENKNFTKQFSVLEKAPLSDVMGELKTKDDYVYTEIYKSKLLLEGFEVSIGIRMPLAFIYATYKGKGSVENFDKILTQLKQLPYDFEIKTDNKSYNKVIEIKSKLTGKKVADLMLDNFGAISIDFATKN